MKIQEIKQSLSDLQRQLSVVQNEMSNFCLDENDYIESYEECLNCEGPINVCGMYFDASHILRNLDETAYSMGLSDYVDSIDKEDHSDYKDLQEKYEELENEICDLESEIDNLEGEQDE